MSDDIRGRIDRIGAKLNDVRQRGLAPFGSRHHQFRLKPPRREGWVASFEAAVGIALPPEYRAFLTLVGDGGAGPAYGLLSIAESLHHDLEYHDPARLRAPFPYVQFDWGDSLVDPVTREGLPLPGALVLCDEGCYHLFLLVVTGPARGEIWFDLTTVDQGYWPMGVGFLEWYERWLDDALAGGSGIWWSGYSPPGYPRPGPPPGLPVA